MYPPPSSHLDSRGFTPYLEDIRDAHGSETAQKQAKIGLRGLTRPTWRIAKGGQTRITEASFGLFS